jgi:hypothetical protein
MVHTRNRNLPVRIGITRESVIMSAFVLSRGGFFTSASNAIGKGWSICIFGNDYQAAVWKPLTLQPG